MEIVVVIGAYSSTALLLPGINKIFLLFFKKIPEAGIFILAKVLFKCNPWITAPWIGLLIIIVIRPYFDFNLANMV